jgi:hypothetical protein
MNTTNENKTVVTRFVLVPGIFLLSGTASTLLTR